MAEERFERTKPYVSIDTISHVGHGRTTLAMAVATVLATKFGGAAKACDQINATSEERARGITISIAHVEYETASHHYAHVDCLGHTSYIKNMVTGVVQMGGTILMYPAADDSMPQTRERILLAYQVDVPYIVMLLSRYDMMNDAELLGLIEMEVYELLSKYSFPGDDTPIVKDSTKLALGDDKGELDEVIIMSLIDALSAHIPTLECAVDGTLLMPVEDVFSISGRDTTVTNRTECGVVKAGEELEVVGVKTARKATYTDVEIFHKLLDQGRTNNDAGILLRNTKREDVERGQALCEPDSIKPHTHSMGGICILPRNGDDRHAPLLNNYRPRFCFHAMDVTGSIELPVDKETTMPGDNMSITVKLIAPIVMEEGLRFAAHESGRTVDTGVVAKVIG